MSLKDWYRAAATPEFDPRYNIAPTTNIVLIRDGEEGRAGSMMGWGLIPGGSKVRVNCRCCITRVPRPFMKRSFSKASFHRQRCLVPASGFYEWQRLADGRKQPFYISSRDGNPLSFAGIWDSATTGEGEKVDSCAILTTDCDALMHPIHERMPVIVPIEDWDTWLFDPMPSTDEVLLPILRPFAPDQMQLWAVSSAVRECGESGRGTGQAFSMGADLRIHP